MFLSSFFSVKYAGHHRIWIIRVGALDLRLSTLLFVSYDAEARNVINTAHLFEIWCQYNAQNYGKNVSFVISVVILAAIFFCCCCRRFWQTHFSIVIFSVKFIGHHPMLELCQTIEFATVFFPFCIAWLISTEDIHTLNMVEISGQYDGQNYGNKISIVIAIVTFDSHNSCIRAIDIFDRLAFFLSSFLDR